MNIRNILAILALLCGVAFSAFAQTDTNSVVLSGTLHKARPKEALQPYYREVILAGGGTERVLLTGEVLKGFDEQLRKFGSLQPIRVTGYFRTQRKSYSGTTQPTTDGWLVWLEVEEAKVDIPPPKAKP
jgi:hypothetical protein